MHIIIIDDHELVRDGIKNLVEQEFGWHVLFDVAAIEELPNADVLADVDVAIIDISLQEASGFDVLNTIKTNYPDVRWLIVHLVLSPAAVMVCVWLFRKYNRRPFFMCSTSFVPVKLKGGGRLLRKLWLQVVAGMRL